jgi:glycosyltransferase involved in cell wall biosynthesis
MGAARKVREVLSTLPRDRTIVHLHGYTKALSSSPVKAAGDMGYAVVCTLHDFFSVCPNGAFFDYRKSTPCPRTALSVSCVAANCDKRHYAHKVFRTLRTFIQRTLGGLPTTVKHYISLSGQSEALLRPYLPANANIHRMANSIDWSRPKQSDVGRNKTILYVGRLDEEKGVRLLAQAAYRLGVEVTFVGDGPLRDVIAAVPRMTVTGWLPRNQVSAHIARARCLVFPSMWYETYGLVVAEAAAYGVPAIVSDISAAAERIEDGLGGWRFRSGDIVDLIRCLQMLDDNARVLSAGESAYSRFWAQAKGGASHAAQLVKIYRDALAF